MADQQNPPNKKVIFALAGIGIAFLVYSMIFDDSGDEKGSEGGAPVAIERGSEPDTDISSIDRDAALAQFAKKFQSLEEQLQLAERRNEEDRKEFEKRLREQSQQNNTEVRALADEVAALRKERVDDAYNALNQVDGGTNIDTPGSIPDSGLSIDDFNLNDGSQDAGQQQVLSNPYGPNYFILNPKRQGFQSTPAGGSEITATEDDLFNSFSAPDTKAFERAAVNSDNKMTEAMDEIHNRPKQAAKPLPEAAPVTYDADGNLVQREKYVIPAFSYVEVTTLHGAACPIGASSPNARSADNETALLARPIVLPVRGIFRGPNGAERDLGNIHLAGLCSGNRTSSSSTGRATIRVEQLSYWDEYGEPQHVAALGYIVDTRDNAQDVYGRLDQASGRTLALQSAAAAAAAYATTLSQAEFTNSTTIGNEGSTTSQSTLTGDASKAAVQQGIAAMFTKISERFEREANAMVDTIIVEPGIKLQFITEQPIEVYKPSEPFDIDASRYDVLI
ncbi:hypothetical protein SAMN05216178_6564 [Pseudomonas saponiphila]|jgi:hypothetical protein|uniref:Conjugal transfer protein TraB n=1 Tax=Pseudomonas saponiphila TaxID=556534 RepID=A0A1H4ZBL4_9PSED|nr:hypothetical protein [Pseudomonas saponiphila]SED27317.1 hypothetical protein SAMN05216178_6564 [Pseudomonas saponiphila]